MFLKQYIQEIWSAVKSLLKGMRRTLYYFTHHKEIITEQYPDNRDTVVYPERFRGEVVMPHNENNEHRCTGCTACELACPNGTIKVVTKFEITPDGKRKRPSTNWYTISNSVPCAIFASRLVLRMQLRWRKLSSIVCTIEAS